MHIEPDQKNTLIVLAVLALIFALAIWLPVRVKEKRLRQQISESQVQLGMDLSGSRGLTQLGEQVDELKSIVSGAQKYVPHKSELAELVRQISSQLEAQQVADQDLKTNAIIEGVDYSVIPIELKFESSFPAASGFLKQLESMQRLIRIHKLQIAGPAGKLYDPLTVHIKLSTFFAAQEVNG